MDERKQPKTFTFSDNFGNEIEFQLIDIVLWNEKEYGIMLPVNGDINVLITEKVEYEDFENYITVNDFETLEAVFEVFKEKNKDTIEFV